MGGKKVIRIIWSFVTHHQEERILPYIDTILAIFLWIISGRELFDGKFMIFRYQVMRKYFRLS